MEKKEYFRRLDIIRIISCILVLLYHLGVLKGGYLAVCTFFTLGGYLECMSALKKDQFSIKKYYINRLKKIYLPLMIVVFITVLIAKFSPSIIWMNLKPETLSVAFGYNNFWQLSANLDYFTRNVNSPFTHFWYISILMQFDLVFPIIFAILRKIDKKTKDNISTAVVLLTMLVTTGVFCYMAKTQDIMRVYYSTIARSFSILFGVYMALVHYEYRIRFLPKLKKHNTLIFALYCILLITLCVVVSDQSNYYAILMILTTFITTRLIKYSTIQNERPEKVDKIVNFFARSTFEIYLVQYPVIFFMRNSMLDDTLNIFVIIGITVVISYIIHFFISAKSKIVNKIKIIVLVAIIVFGSLIVITEQDSKEEMQELEDILTENAKIMEERNKKFLEETTSEEKKSKNSTSEANTKTNNNQIVNTTTNNTTEKGSKMNTNTKNEAIANAKITGTDEKTIAEQIKKLPVVGIGDSVMLDAVNEFYKKFPSGYFDGKISRSLYAAQDVVKNLKNKGKLSNVLILCLATNGDYSDTINKNFMKLVGNRDIFWITAVGADDPKFNQKFKKFAANYPNIHIVDWEVEGKKHPEYFYKDGVHMKYGKGMKAYVDFIYQSVYNYYLEKSKSASH